MARCVPFFAFDVPSTRRQSRRPDRPRFDSCSRVVTRREEAIELALKAKLEQRRVEREQAQSANRAEIEAFTAEFLNAARECFLMIDKDNSGTLTKTEIVHSVSTDKSVKDFLQNCGEPNLQFLLVPARLEASLDALDTSKDGELDMDECTGAASCSYFSSGRLNACSMAWRYGFTDRVTRPARSRRRREMRITGGTRLTG